MADIEAPAQAIDNGQAKEDLNSQSRSAGQLMSYLRLYRYGDTIDYVAIFLGVVGSLLNAPTMPLFAYVFGEVRYVDLVSSRRRVFGEGTWLVQDTPLYCPPEKKNPQTV
jgi:hypothetical protein